MLYLILFSSFDDDALCHHFDEKLSVMQHMFIFAAYLVLLRFAIRRLLPIAMSI